MQVNRERQKPAHDADDGKRGDLLFDSACDLHSVCAVGRLYRDAPILYL
jgi:hypothetical protein